MTLTVVLDMPPSTNSVYKRSRNGRMYMTDAGTSFKAITTARVKNTAQLLGYRFTKKDRIEFTLRLWFANRNRCDIDNRVKLVEDATAAALGFDDTQIDRLTVERRSTETDPPYCMVIVRKLEVTK